MHRRLLLLAAIVALAAAAPAAADAPHWPAWLCRPGLKVNYCNTDLSVTVIGSNGAYAAYKIADTKPKIDCFYVYPTVSEEKRGNADLKITHSVEYTVLAQAARFSEVCRVFAPVYRQGTVYGGGSSDVAYASVLAAWRDYLAHYNDGRGVVLIGHSQGSFMLERLIEQQYASMRGKLVSAILLGGDVAVGSNDVFSGVPACSSVTQTGCIVAYSSWGQTPPSSADEQSVSNASQHVLCVNPAAPGGGSAAITPIFPWFLPEGIAGQLSPQPTTFWVAFPYLYTARCVRQGTRSWLLITRIPHAGDPRPTVKPILSANEGLHAADVNIALGQLLMLVQSETKTYLASH